MKLSKTIRSKFIASLGIIAISASLAFSTTSSAESFSTLSRNILSNPLSINTLGSFGALFASFIQQDPGANPDGEPGGKGLNPARKASDNEENSGEPRPEGYNTSEEPDIEENRRYIIKFREFGPAARAAVRGLGGDIRLELPEYKALAARLPAQALQGLQNNPNVEYIELDAKRYPMQTGSSWNDIVSPSGEISPYGIQMVQADQLTDTAAGNRKVCIIDSGYYRAHDDLQKGSVTASPDSGTGDPFTDRDGHGTHVAGTVAGIGNNGTGVRGVNQSQRINLHIVKVFGDSGAWAYSSNLVNAVTECRNAGSHIISMSLGGPSNVSAENTAFTNAYNAGVLSIAAAGNAGTTALSYPASYSTVVSVAAVDSNENHADFSQRNSQVEIAAPGVAVLSTVPYKETNSLTVGGTTYNGNYIDFAARNNGVTGNLVSGGRCTATNSGWSGQVVLCERGDVSFWDKVRNVQNSGGRAAVIYNNAPGGFFGTMDPNTSTIPAISLSQEDGVAILNSGSMGTASTVVSRNQKPATHGYDYFNGTSMATPHVSGVAALVWSYNPGWTNAQIRTAMQQTARDKGASGRDNLFGFGIVQAKAMRDSLCQSTGVGCSTPVEPAPTATEACLLDTSQADLDTGDNSNVNLNVTPGDVKLFASGATESLNAQQDSQGTSGNVVSTTTWQGQTFRPTITGRLSRLDVSFFCNSCSGTQPMTVEIRTTSGGLPTNNVLATTTIPAFAGSSAYRTATFNNPATLEANTQYAYVLRLTTANTAGSYAHNRTNNDSYAGGTGVGSTNSGGTWTAQSTDFRFKTYISVGTLAYATEGNLVSSIKDSNARGNNVTKWNTLSWNADTPSGTSVRFQVAASDSAGGPFNFVGPDGSGSSFYTMSGASLERFNGYRYLRYKAYLGTSDTTITPTLNDVTICVNTIINTVTAKAKNVTVSADASCAASGVSVDDGSFDPEGDAIEITQSSTGPFPVGTTQVTLTVTDSWGLSSSQTATVTVVDDTKPVINTPADITRSTDAGQATAVVNFAVTASDNCGVSSLMSSPASGSAFPMGTTTVTNTATDVNGNVSTSTFTVTVRDEEAPVLNLPANIVVTLPARTTATSMAVNFTVTATDNAPGVVSIVLSRLSGSIFPVGTTTVTATATDVAGNSSQGSFTVTVRYAFSGFLSPIANLPAINDATAGNAVPIKFSLSGNKGLDVLLSVMSPTSVQINCTTGVAIGEEVEGTPKGKSGLNYDSKADHYTYAWGTDRSWAGTCRELNVKLIDGSQNKARFNFK